MQKETWEQVPGYEGYYEASSLGKIRSVDRLLTLNNGSCVFYESVILSPKIDKGGYAIVVLSKEGKRIDAKVHRVVASAFLGLRLHIKKCNRHSITVDHKNNIKLDNRVGNLQLMSLSMNSSKLNKESPSNLIGGYEDKNNSTWVAQVKYNRKSFHIGRFKTQRESSEAHNIALDYIDRGLVDIFNKSERSNLRRIIKTRIGV